MQRIRCQHRSLVTSEGTHGDRDSPTQEEPFAKPLCRSTTLSTGTVKRLASKQVHHYHQPRWDTGTRPWVPLQLASWLLELATDIACPLLNYARCVFRRWSRSVPGHASQWRTTSGVKYAILFIDTIANAEQNTNFQPPYSSFPGALQTHSRYTSLLHISK